MASTKRGADGVLRALSENYQTVVIFSAIDPAELVLLQQKCESLNMVVRTELRKDDKTFDYCVSESVTGIRCQVARAYKKPIVTKEWVYACERIKGIAGWHNYRLPTLCGLKICITGNFANDERIRMAEVIAENGGEVCADLTKHVCTHLIPLSNDTEKFLAAERWGPEVIRIVSKEWLADCVRAQGAGERTPAPGLI